MSILIKNPWIVTQDKVRSVVKKDVYIEDNKIIQISENINLESDFKIDGAHMILLPGLINTHTHIAMGTLRGAADDVTLNTFLQTMFKLDAVREDEDLYYSSLLGIQELIRTGTTTILDLYYSEDIIAKAVQTSGLRAFLAWVVLDKEYTTQKGDPVNNAEEFIRNYDARSTLITPVVGMQGVYVCNKETLLKGKEIAEKYNKLITMHIAETRKEVYDHQNSYGLRPVQYLNKIGFLSDRVIAVHTVFVTMAEIKMLANKAVSVSHNPISNMKLGNGGAAPIPEMLESKVNVTLGTDSVASNNNLDMFQVMKVTALLHKNTRWNAAVLNAQQVLDFATINAAKALKIEKQVGSVEEGKIADLILIDPMPNGIPITKSNIVSNVVYALEGMNVDTTIINGKIVMLHKKLQQLPDIYEKLNMYVKDSLR